MSDTSSGTVLMGMRLYAPTIGRFLQVDPEPGGSANAYDYVSQDPVDVFDLQGQKPIGSFGWSTPGERTAWWKETFKLEDQYEHDTGHDAWANAARGCISGGKFGAVVDNVIRWGKPLGWISADWRFVAEKSSGVEVTAALCAVGIAYH